MSQYERSYVRWFWRNNARNLLILCILLSVIPLLSYVTTNLYDGDYNKQIPFTTSLFFYAGVSLILAYCMPLYQFRYLMQKRAAELFYAMPIKKGRFFLIQFLLGACIVLVLPMLAYVCAILLSSACYAYLDACMFMVLLVGGLSFAFYSIVTYFTLKCNNLWDACAVNLGYVVAMLMLFVGVLKIAQSVVQQQLVSFSGNGEEVISQEFMLSILSLPASMIYFCSGICEAVYSSLYGAEGLWTIFREAAGVRLGYFIYWLMLGLVFACFAYRVYQKRPQEESEERTSTVQCYPVLIILVTTSLLFLCEMTYGYLQTTSIINISIVLVLYWTMVCFAKRKIHISKQMVAAFLGMCVLSYGISFVFVKSNGFGRIHEMPAEASIASASIAIELSDDGIRLEEMKDVPIQYLYMEETKKSALIDEIYAVHRMVLENIELDDSSVASAYFTFRVRYRLENGKDISRSYTVPNDCYLKMEDQLMEWIDEGLFDSSLQSSYKSYQYEQEAGSLG